MRFHSAPVIRLADAKPVQPGHVARAVFQQGHRDLAVETLPAVLRPRKGRFGLVDQEKAFCHDPKAADIFDLRGIDRDAGCLVVVRPDQYVAHVLPLDAHDDLTDFLAGVLLEAVRSP